MPRSIGESVPTGTSAPWADYLLRQLVNNTYPMEFKTLQDKIIENAIAYGEKYNVTIDEDFALLKLYEEVGEFSQAVLIHRKKSRPEKHVAEEVSKKELAKELADVVGMAIVNAHLLGIDLENAIDKKWINKESPKTQAPDLQNE